MFEGKKILITGGSGFLGQALIRRLIKEGVDPQDITIFARNEGKLLETQQKLKVNIITGDTSKYSLVRMAMEDADVVFHLSAFKHLPLAETQSEQCIESNIVGSLNVLRASVETYPELVLGVSTDKAYNPINCYGMTKRLMEYLFQQYECNSEYTAYRVVRYGNVLASTGSVLQVWEKAKKLGEPIMLTDPDMTRFFFTVNEAVNTIFDCINTSTDATPYIPKMRSIRMGDLAEVVAEGHEIKIIGRRAGEKGDESMSEDYSSDTAERMTQDDIRAELENIGLL